MNNEVEMLRIGEIGSLMGFRVKVLSSRIKKVRGWRKKRRLELEKRTIEEWKRKQALK